MSPDVKAIQYLLQARGFYVPTPDGIFGAKTTAAVRAFQRRNGLKADGIVAKQTLTKLIVTVKRGDKGNAVRALQILMREPTDEVGGQPFHSLKVDGIFGSATDADVREYQGEWVGLYEGRKTKSDGVVGPQTWCVLFGGEL